MMQSQNEQRKTPFNHFISLLVSKILLLISLNLLFILTSIPLFTLPISISSMQKVIQGMISGKEQPSVFKAYFSAFKTNFVQSSLFGIPLIGILFGIGYGAYFYYLNSDSILFVTMSILSILLFVLVYCVSLMGFQMITSVELSLKIIIKNSVILTFSNPKISLIGGVFSLGIVGLGIWFFPYSTPLLLLIIFSLSSYVSTFIAYPMIQKYIIKR